MFPPRSSGCDLSDGCLLDYFLGSLNCVSAALSNKIDSIEVMGILIDRLRFVSVHDALMQLRNSFSFPSSFILWTSPRFLSCPGKLL